MQVICVSRGSLSGGKEVAGRLARELGYPALSREDLIEAATAAGIPVGKLEASLIGARAFGERLARARDHYLAFSTAYLCDRAAQGPLLYHGRTGHLLLQGIPHVFRVRVVADEEYRIRAAMAQLGLDRDRAQRYLADIEVDRRNWVRSMYGVSWEDALQYDLVVNVAQFSAENAAAALVGAAQLPDFQFTPASHLALEDLRLCAHARLRLARDARTEWAGFTVGAHDGIVTVTYLPKDMELAGEVERVLAGLDGAREVRATMATSTILWVQESFEPRSETFNDLVEIANKWNAAVELVRFDASTSEVPEPEAALALAGHAPAVIAGIEDDTEPEPRDAGGLRATLNELARAGRSGGARSVTGERSRLVASCCATVSYSLVVVGNLFLGKDPAAKQRLTRELQDLLESRMRVPVVTADELRKRYLFGTSDAIRLAGSAFLVAGLYVLVLTHQEPVLSFLAMGEGASLPHRLAAAAAVFLFVPLVAYTYGTLVRSVMKLVKME